MAYYTVYYTESPRVFWMAFIRTSPFRKDPQYSRSIVVPLHRPTADMSAIGDVWSMRQKRRTPAYTTNGADIPIVRA
jgi:hypothetical protein